MKRLLLILLALCMAIPAGCAIPTGNVFQEPTEEAAATSLPTVPVAVESEGAASTRDTSNTSNTSENVVAKLPVTLYYQDGDRYLIPLTRWIEKQQGIAKAAVNGLTDGAITREELLYYGVYPVLPVNTDVLGINIKDGIAVVDFNKSLLNYEDEVSERNIVASVVYTLTEFSTVQSVRILINGYPQKVLKFGTDISEPLSRENVSINATNQKAGNNSAKADVYCFKRANEGFTYLLPVSVEYTPDAEGLKAETLVKLLLKGSADENLQSEMPAASLLDCSMNAGVLTLNFDNAFIKYGGTTREEGILKQLAYTLRQLKGPGRIKILIEGTPAELPEGTDISKGLVIPVTINDYIDR